MKQTVTYFIFACCLMFAITGCKKEKGKTFENISVAFNEQLADTLSKMTEKDQYYAGIPKGKYQGNWEAWYAVRDSSVRLHKAVLEEIIKKYGYPGYDLVGEVGESDFWVMVQHSDFDPEFQASVLPLLKAQVDNNNANGSHYGLLVDRVRKNTNRPQLYGTQVDYNKFGQAYIKNLADSVNVNNRRKELGMELLEEYLNGMTKMHFEMNKTYLNDIGITEPKLHEIPVSNE